MKKLIKRIHIISRIWKALDQPKTIIIDSNGEVIITNNSINEWSKGAEIYTSNVKEQLFQGVHFDRPFEISQNTINGVQGPTVRYD